MSEPEPIKAEDKKTTARKNKLSDADQVSQLMAGLEHPLKAEIELIREIIKGAGPELVERVKWKAPSYFYRQDMAAFNLHRKEFVQLIFVFPEGLIQDDSGLLQGKWADRREARFMDRDDIKTKQPALETVVKAWVEKIKNTNSDDTQTATHTGT